MTESSALTVVDQSSAALAAFGFSEDQPLKPTRLELIQPIQVGDEPGLIAGRFRDQQSNLQYEEVNLVPLLMTTGRVLFPPGGELGAKPVCRSNDGAFPIVDGELVRQDGGQGCAKCSKSQWKRIGGKAIRPECNETASFLFAELETSFIFRYNGKGMALGPLRDLKETIRKIVYMARAKGQFAPPYGLTFKLASTKIKGGKGTYFIPKFTPTGQVHPDDLAKFQGIFTYFNTHKSQTEEEAAPASDPVTAAVQGEYVDTPTTYEAA